MNPPKIVTVIIETNVFGCKAYHFRCLTCGVQSKRHDRQSHAVNQAKKHQCRKLTKEEM